MKNYTKSSIRDLGAVADLTQANINGPASDNTFIQPVAGITVIGTVSGQPNPGETLGPVRR